MKKLICPLLSAFSLLWSVGSAMAAGENQAPKNHFCIGNADHPERKTCDDSAQDDYYTQYPQTAEDVSRNERYMQNHQTYVCQSVTPSYAEGARMREYIVTDPRDCR